MSAKYQRVKQADLALPAPLRWLTRAFSSITLAVILLTAVALYGIVGSVPLFMLALGALYALAIAAAFGTAGLVCFGVWRVRAVRWPGRAVVVLALLALAGWAAYEMCVAAYQWAQDAPWLANHRATVIYRLPFFEMTELEFYSWWPMKAILITFVINMIWATIRRIEFKFVNIGVLTVHSGIVVIALGSILYGYFKVEGDTILFREDLGGGFVNHFYDAFDPAVYVSNGTHEMMAPVPSLPRYNDYAIGGLNIALHERAGFGAQFGDNVRMTIPGFIAYGSLVERWQAPGERTNRSAVTGTSPAVRLRFEGGQQHQRAGQTVMLAADVPADRVVSGDTWAVEYLVAPDKRRLRDLNSSFTGNHGLVVAIPEQNFRKVYSIAPGKTIRAGDTGYTINVRGIGPYNMPFATEGYEDANDTRAVLQVTGNGKDFTRIAMHRYPERSQDFVQPPEDAPHDPTVGPMGQRKDPDPDVHLAYLDNTKIQYHLIADSARDDQLEVIVRFPNGHLAWLDMPEAGLPLSAPDRRGLFFHLEQRFEHARRVLTPVSTPKAQRRPNNEGTYLESLLPVRIRVDRPESEGGPWQRLVWLRHMRYPMRGEGAHKPVTVDVPTVGELELIFSRRRYQLPFAMKLRDFEMTPYAGSNMPRDFQSNVLIADTASDGMITEQPTVHSAHLNNPIVYHPGNAGLRLGRVKISQTGWDPPPEAMPPAEANAKDAQGRFVNQQRFTILGIGNNVGAGIIAAGCIMVVLGIPWAFWIKPVLVRRQARKLQQELAAESETGHAKKAEPQAPTTSLA